MVSLINRHRMFVDSLHLHVLDLSDDATPNTLAVQT